jgi:phospholipid transport system substrate-binding protein
MKKNMSNVIRFLIVLLSLGIFSNVLATEKDASNFINDTANRVIDIVRNKNFSESDKEQRLNDIFCRAVDTKWIGRFSLGQYWRSINEQQQGEFLELYTKYLTSMYVPNFKKYTGNVVKVTGAKEIRPNEYLVLTVIVNPADQRGNIQINYLLRQDPNALEKFIIFDVIAEGVSLITTQRAELASTMANNGFDATINLLRRKTDTQD